VGLDSAHVLVEDAAPPDVVELPSAPLLPWPAMLETPMVMPKIPIIATRIHP
jgi:hypothetical protein